MGHISYIKGDAGLKGGRLGGGGYKGRGEDGYVVFGCLYAKSS